MANSQKMTIVVARHNENLEWLKTLAWDYIVYNKGEELPKWVKNVVNLQNIGREAHTYLTYIIDHYDNLPDYVAFVQGDPYSHTWHLIKKMHHFEHLVEKALKFNASCDFYALSDSVLIADGFGRPDHPGLMIGESAKKIFLKNIQLFRFPMGAQFISSKRAILFHTKETYQVILDYLIKAEPAKDPKNTHRSPEDAISPGYKNLFSGWVMERLWPTLLDCEHKTIYD